MDRITSRLIDKHVARYKQGLAKYETTMDRDDLTKLDWLKHAQEEAMDMAIYLEKLIQIEEEVLRKEAERMLKEDSCKVLISEGVE